MNPRAVITFLIGLVLAAGAVLLVANSNKPQTAVAEAPAMEVVNILVAANELQFGNRIGAEHVRLVAWPAGSVPAGSFASVDALLGNNEDERVVLKPMTQGEPILANKVSGFGGRGTMSAVIPEGKRAFAVQVDAVSGVAGFLLPGDRVDVLLTRRMDGNSGERVSDLILQNIMVRGIDQMADEDRNKPQVVRTVTLEVSPQEAQKLALAMEAGSLSLALRNMQTSEIADAQTVSIQDLTPAVVQEAPAGSARRELSVVVRRGSEASVVPVDGD